MDNLKAGRLYYQDCDYGGIFGKVCESNGHYGGLKEYANVHTNFQSRIDRCDIRYEDDNYVHMIGHR